MSKKFEHGIKEKIYSAADGLLSRLKFIENHLLNRFRANLALSLEVFSDPPYSIQKWENGVFMPPDFYPHEPVSFFMERNIKGVEIFRSSKNRDRYFGWHVNLETLHKQNKPGGCFILSCADGSSVMGEKIDEYVVRKYSKAALLSSALNTVVGNFIDRINSRKSGLEIARFDNFDNNSVESTVKSLMSSLLSKNIPIVSIDLIKYLDLEDKKSDFISSHRISVVGVIFDNEGKATIKCIDPYLGYIDIAAERLYHSLGDYNHFELKKSIKT